MIKNNSVKNKSLVSIPEKKLKSINKMSDTFDIDYEKVFRNINDGILIHKNGLVIDANEAFLRLFGFKLKEIKGTNSFDSMIDLSSKDMVKSKIAEKYEKPYEIYGVKKNGTKFPIEVKAKEFNVNGINLRIVSCRDITYRKQDREIIKISDQKYRILFETSKDAIMTLEPPTWKFTSGNLETLKLFKIKDSGELKKLGPSDLSPTKQPNGQWSEVMAKKMITLAMKTGSALFEWTHQKTDGQEFLASVLLTRVELGSKIFLQATVRDISREKENELKLKEKVEEMEKLNKIMIGRELKMVELKEEINKLKNKKFIK